MNCVSNDIGTIRLGLFGYLNIADAERIYSQVIAGDDDGRP